MENIRSRGRVERSGRVLVVRAQPETESLASWVRVVRELGREESMGFLERTALGYIQVRFSLTRKIDASQGGSTN
jgi:hypothetical protein